MTGITENVVKYTYCIAKLELELLDTGQEQSRALGRNKTASHGRRLMTGYILQCQNQSQHSHGIFWRGKRDWVEIELQRLLSEPDELIGDFQEDSDYETVLKQIEKENADDIRNRLRQLWKETFYWPIIQ
jgi:hypothetical protein